MVRIFKINKHCCTEETWTVLERHGGLQRGHIPAAVCMRVNQCEIEPYTVQFKCLRRMLNKILFSNIFTFFVRNKEVFVKGTKIQEAARNSQVQNLDRHCDIGREELETEDEISWINYGKNYEQSEVT